ncbi:MAG: carbohydrate kinase family protein [Caldilineaceae bacterium]
MHPASTILVAGLINIETTLRIDGFPLDYNPQNFPFFGVASSVSGVGFNVAKALSVLGSRVDFLSLIGDDLAGQSVQGALAAIPVGADHVLPLLPQTCQSVILYDRSGRRQIHSDLKDIQERTYPLDRVTSLLPRLDAAVVCNINFARPLLAPLRRAGTLIATDVHALQSLDAEYEQDFLRAAQVLFLSHERLQMTPEQAAHEILARFPARLVVIGLGSQGALLAVRDDRFVGRFPAVKSRPVVSTIGAGDALFSAFLDGYLRSRNPYASLQRAIRFASWKIGVASASEGFLTADQLDTLANDPEESTP